MILNVLMMLNMHLQCNCGMQFNYIYIILMFIFTDSLDLLFCSNSGTLIGKTYGIAKKATAVAVKILDATGTGTTL